MLDKHYDHEAIEKKWYAAWEKSGLFHAEVDRDKEPYTIVIPPPNVTGMLHLGHVLNNTIQDIMARYKRMRGYNVCWVPGTDHAGIATQTMVEKHLRQEGIDPNSLSRDAFLDKVWTWKEKFGGIIIKQLRRLGSSLDWERERFTMDEVLSKAVRETFVRLYKKGSIYKGNYIVNWCPTLQTALSDDEVDRTEEDSFLWHFKYPLADGDGHLVVATTRPETMLGDTGVAVHPQDERYKHLIGKMIKLPIVGREIPIFADEHVEMDFGTGCVKVTPAHDMDDFQMGTKHGLPFIVVMDKTAHMNENTPEPFRGMYRSEARKAVVAKMDELGLLEKIEPHKLAVGRCYRTKDIIEPYLSEQWFIKMDEMAAMALPPVLEGKIKFYPERWVNTYKYWLENIKDWCISRQLKWGHRIPVWYCAACGQQTCESTDPDQCASCGSTEITQDPDVLDTWASSWLFPFSVFGWPDKSEDLSYFYPTATLVTGPDIIFFWVARMIMAGNEFMGEIPFREVYFNGIVRDMEGRKMSKTLGNSPDPLDIIDTYGADALRFTMVYQTPYGADCRFSAESCELGRGFCTKIWNANRFLEMSFEGVAPDQGWRDGKRDVIGKWILSRLAATVMEVETDLETFKIANAGSRIYNFFWGDFCDWYVEFMKPLLREADETEKARLMGRTAFIIDACLRILHPFMPFVTEALWQNMAPREEGELLMGQTWPEVDNGWLDADADQAVAQLRDLISGVRAVRKSYNLSNKSELKLYVFIDEKGRGLIDAVAPILGKLAGLESYSFLDEAAAPSGCVALALHGFNAYVDLKGHIDLDAERTKIDRQLEKLEKEIRGFEGRLNNPKFVDRAPAEVVAKAKAELLELERQRDTLKMSREDLEKMGR